MSNVMRYRNYSARIEYDDEDGIFFGRIAGIRDGIGFHAESVDDLRAAFREAVDDYIATCAKVGKEPQKPYSGRMMFRVSPDVHRRAAPRGRTCRQEPQSVGRGSAFERRSGSSTATDDLRLRSATP